MKYSLSGYGGDTNAFLCTGVLILSDKLHCPSASLRYWCVVLQMKQSKPSKQAGFSIALYTTENSRASFEQSQSKYKLEMDQRDSSVSVVFSSSPQSQVVLGPSNIGHDASSACPLKDGSNLSSLQQ